MSDKTEQPTSKKREDARAKGQIAVSRDLARVISLTALSELALATEPWWREAISGLMLNSIAAIGQPFHERMLGMIQSAGLLLLLVFGTCLVVCGLLAFISHWGQFGILISTESLTPSLDKLNPVNGIKQLFSKKKLSELLLSLFKATVMLGLTFFLVRDQISSILHLAGGEPKDIYEGFIILLRSVLHSILILCGVLGLLDFALQRYFLTKNLMMDMQEIKREYKESEGDPMVKGMRKQLARQWAQEEPVAKTGDANAVVVNPTHFAVAMRYDTSTPVPQVLAKGRDEVARAMIARAHELGIPVIRHVWLARTLYATARPGGYVPSSSYEAVAQVYAAVKEVLESGREHTVLELERYGTSPDAAGA
ncbi:type III secretion system export apparatus subunit SctU [Janthinobacterium agaricidamnosum]|uniref:FlhB HrpN YscU SpaS family protein n=1 Tax=Janthinobacterium agaricidamnosum NBRC 102515 = DSM 9628 TaxID=1349767 RepID=W0V358_9BURK|nr:type III secretion system export apparatus subunit SctU [Janthinobacterium agaricidamnosum]CDG82306.1 flhB HrpN YscU SpaS family protein [Janthinobacterium agaricidamnosum NBRC 102515 = DSM 9628]